MGLAMMAASSEENMYSGGYGVTRESKKRRNRPNYGKAFESDLNKKSKEVLLGLLVQDLETITSKEGTNYSVDGFTIPSTNLKNAYKIKRKLLGTYGFDPDLHYNEIFEENKQNTNS